VDAPVGDRRRHEGFWSVNDSQTVRARVRRDDGWWRLAAGTVTSSAAGSQGDCPSDAFAAAGDVPDLAGQRAAGPTAGAYGLCQRRANLPRNGRLIYNDVARNPRLPMVKSLKEPAPPQPQRVRRLTSRRRRRSVPTVNPSSPTTGSSHELSPSFCAVAAANSSKYIAEAVATETDSRQRRFLLCSRVTRAPTGSRPFSPTRSRGVRCRGAANRPRDRHRANARGVRDDRARARSPYRDVSRARAW
jgi:hypothetical protein